MRSDNGANTALTAAAAARTHHTSVICTLPCIKPRDASARCVTGFNDTTFCSQPGMVAGLTKMLLTMVSGNSSRKLEVITDSGVFTSILTTIQIQARLVATV